MSNKETTKCIGCEEPIDPEHDECQWSDSHEGYACIGCVQSADESASRVYINKGGEVEEYIVTEYVTYDIRNGDIGSRYNFKRGWHATDGWRGYYETDLEGFTEVLDGWTTGNWGDSVGQRKQVINEWIDEILQGDAFAPCTVAVICDPTSNVFSTSIKVLVPTNKVDTFKDWVGEELEALSNSLS